MREAEDAKLVSTDFVGVDAANARRRMRGVLRYLCGRWLKVR